MKKVSKYVAICIVFLLGFLMANIVRVVSAQVTELNSIRTCVKNNGTIRIIGISDNCNSNESLLSWRKEPEPGTEYPLICLNCDLTGIGDRFKQRDLKNAYLIGARFDSSSVDLTDTSFVKANLSEARFEGTTMLNNDFTNANLTNANFTGQDTSTFIWSNTTCPDGSNSDSHSNTCEGHF